MTRRHRKSFTFVFLLVCFFSHSLFADENSNRSGFTERERQQQAAEQNRKETNMIQDAYKPNEKWNPSKVDVSNIDSNVQITPDHKALTYDMIIEGDRVMIGPKLSSGIMLGLYHEQNGERWRLATGIELQGDYITDQLLYYVGGGFQLGGKGDKSFFYFNGGLDHRVLSWFKLQYGLNWVVTGDFGLTIGTGFTF